MSKFDNSFNRQLGAWFDDESSKLIDEEVCEQLLHDAEARRLLQDWRDLRKDLQLLEPAELNAVKLEHMRLRFQKKLSEELKTADILIRRFNWAAAILFLLSVSFLLMTSFALPDFDAYATQSTQLDQAIQDFFLTP